MTFKLPELPYAYDALEPHIDARTMEIHHGKHHNGYTNNLNAALEKHPEFFEKSIEEILSDLGSVPGADCSLRASRSTARTSTGRHYRPIWSRGQVTRDLPRDRSGTRADGGAGATTAYRSPGVAASSWARPRASSSPSAPSASTVAVRLGILGIPR